MSGHDRSLIDRLVRRGWEFDFFPAVWLLERFAAGGAPVGEVGPVSAERIRFRPEVSMVFPATDVRRVAVVDGPSEDESIYQIDVTFMGLYGVSTPLPLHYAVDVLRSVMSGTRR
jgi:type VI secretion system protein ImpH